MFSEHEGLHYSTAKIFIPGYLIELTCMTGVLAMPRVKHMFGKFPHER